MRQVTVEEGQSVSRIAHRYHVSEKAIVAANHLAPPYRLRAGMRLWIPDRNAPNGAAPVQTATAPAAPAAPVAPATPLPAPAGAAPAKGSPEVVPLDGPPPAAAASPSAPPAGSGPPAVVAPRNPASALPLPGEQAATGAPPAAPAATPQAATVPPPPPPQVQPQTTRVAGGRFPWPVRGRVLSGFGGSAEGARNDGINISAPRGTPVQAIDTGVVAYVGNEVRGYGNLILVKHANGWISAYAHLENIEVKLGDEVSGGQEIAKVGNTGGVIEPQLHFELRRGKTPVDPRQYLAPTPSAGAGGGASKG
jgi:murein DD-endopeptidase MepM/ murein hydrolase activator NlpD